MAKFTNSGPAKPDDPIYKSGSVVGAKRIDPNKKGKVIIRGWQKSAKNAPQPTGIITGANLKKPARNQKLTK